MKVRLTLLRASAQVNLNVTVDSTATVGDVAAALGAAGPDEPGRRLNPAEVTLVQAGGQGPPRALDPGTLFADCGVRSGSVVQVGAAQERSVSAGARIGGQVRVLSGPDEGATFDIPIGASLVGRGPKANVRLKDPLVSNAHMRITLGNGIEVTDLNSSNGVLVADQRVQRIRVGPADVVNVGDTLLQIVQLRPADANESSTIDIQYIRPPRVVPAVPDLAVQLPDVPRPRSKPRFPLIAMVAPLMMGAVMYTMTKSPMSLIFIALSPIIMIGNWIDGIVRGRREMKRGRKDFAAAITRAKVQATAYFETERDVRHAQQPAVATVVDEAKRLAPMLWTRRPEHPEFLRLRLGIGADYPLTKIEDARAKEGPADLLDQLDEVQSEYRLIPEVPIVASLRSDGALAAYGDDQQLAGIARSLVAQVIALHSPAEVIVVCLTSAAGKGRWGWLEWVPHTASPHSPLGDIHLASDPATATLLLARIEGLISSRSSGEVPDLRGPIRDTGMEENDPMVPSIVLVVDGPTIDHARLNRVVESGPDVGVYTMWFAEYLSQVPAACRTFIELSDSGARVGKVRNGLNYLPIAVELVPQQDADELGRVLAPVADAGVPVSDDSDLPRSISFVGLTGHELADDATAQVVRWQENNSIINRSESVPLRSPVSLSALVGQGVASPVALDLRVHGPHALVGGTTGAGKSEFLQAWVLAMAQAQSPDRINFLFVDYKGGSAFSKCTQLPHCVGLVTDLSPYLVRRALTSLRAELRYREHLLNEKGAKDLVTLEKSGDPDCPPSLIIVVDEFAALVGEVPEFVDGVVDVAQRGRSLGLHLVLATQRPAGVIKDNLRANTNLRIALRMADESDSQDVLGEKIAAHFDPEVPGRGAVKTGPGRIMAFQSAYPGAKTSQLAAPVSIGVEQLTFGIPKQWRVPAPPPVAEDQPQDIDRIVATIGLAADQAKLRKPRKPWRDALAPTYDLNQLPMRRDSELLLGVVDDPTNQRQVVEYFEPDKQGNIAYYGAAGSGKSTALRMLALAAAFTPRSGDVQVYGLDFAGGGLRMLESLPHVGSIIVGDDEERVSRLLRFLSELVAQREEKFGEVNASSITQYRRIVGSDDEQRILLLVDGFGTFRAEYEKTADGQRLLDQLQQLLVDGRSFGIHVAATVERPNALPNSMASSFLKRVVLRQADEDGYLALGLPKDVLNSASPPGRAMQVGDPRELQLPIIGDNVNSVTQARLVDGLAEFIATQQRVRPVEIRRLPVEIPASTVSSQAEGLPVLGIASDSLGPVGLKPTGAVLIAGPQASGKTSTVRWLATSLRRWSPDVVLAHLSAGRTPLANLEIWDASAIGVDSVRKLVPKLNELAEKVAPEDRPTIAVFIESYPDFLQSAVETELSDLVGLLRRNGHLAVGEGELSAWNSTWPMIQAIRSARTGLILQPDSQDGDILLRTPTPRIRRGEMPPGRGYWIGLGKATKVQVPYVD